MGHVSFGLRDMNNAGMNDKKYSKLRKQSRKPLTRVELWNKSNFTFTYFPSREILSSMRTHKYKRKYLS